MAFQFNPFTGTFDIVGDPAPKSFVAPYLIDTTDPALVIENKNVLLLASNVLLDGEIRLDGMVVSD